MRISENGVALIKMFEGLELESYQDIAGVWTIGYGHTETAGPNQKINEREAEELLRRDLEPRERAVAQLVGVSLNQNEFDALVSFVFNVGAGAFKTSTARKRLNRNDRIGAAEALTWWNKATVNGVLREVRGLTRRRAAEKALFLTPVNPPIVNRPDEIAENSRLTPTEEAPRRESLGDSRTVQGAVVAGGAGAAASSIGRESAQDLDQLEKNIEQGTGLTEKPPGQGGIGDPTPADGTAGATDGALDGGATGGDGSAAGDQGSTGGGAEGGAAADDVSGEGSTGGATAGADDRTTGESLPDAGEDSAAAPDAGATTQTIAVEGVRPSAREKNAVDAQLQFALLVIILLSALYIIFARIDDWWKYRR
jgi:lysozyme